jgi:hypothetical protein
LAHAAGLGEVEGIQGSVEGAADGVFVAGELGEGLGTGSVAVEGQAEEASGLVVGLLGVLVVSVGRTASLARSPCLRELRLEAALPSGVLGPVLSWALRGLASSLLWEGMVTLPHGKGWQAGWKPWRAEGA